MRIETLVVALGLACAACSGGAGPEEREAVLDRYIAAVNSNSVEAALALHTADAEFVIPGQAPIKGIAAMGDLLRWDSVLSSELHFEPMGWRGDTLVAGPGWERSAWFEGIGVDTVFYAAGTRFVFEGELLAGVYPSGLRADFLGELGPKWQAFFDWAAERSPEVAELAPEGQFVYTGEAAERWLAILAEYGSAPTDLIGDFVDDYGSTYSISVGSWRQGEGGGRGVGFLGRLPHRTERCGQSDRGGSLESIRLGAPSRFFGVSVGLLSLGLRRSERGGRASRRGARPGESTRRLLRKPVHSDGAQGLRAQGDSSGMAIADLVLLRDDPLADIRNTRSIQAVVLAGRVHDRAALDALLLGVEEAVDAWEDAGN